MTDRPDSAPSSEELIRRARMGLGHESAPDAPDSLDYDEPLGSSAPPDTPVMDDSPASPPEAPVMDDSSLPPAPDPAATRGKDDPTSLLPEHFRPENEAPTARTQGNFNWVRWVIPIGVLGFVLFNFLTADTAVDDLLIGDCFMNPTEIEITTVETVECAEPHDYEVFAFVDLAERGGGFPGDEALFSEADEACFNPFLVYTGLDLDTADLPEYWYDVFVPDETSWADGNRESMCAIFAIDTSFNPVASTGSARGG